MNCYYSNLIEGHNTRPADIECALANEELAPEACPLALEAKAHVRVQRSIDAMHRLGNLPSPTSVEFISWAHRAFYEEMPVEFRFVERPDGTKVEIVPGVLRTAPDEDVMVGRHRPPEPDRVAAFMEHFARRFATAEKSASTRIIGIASAHHRLNYIHPFQIGRASCRERVCKNV